MFFGHPGAGKTTLCHRFGEIHGVPGLDTDRFMTDEERDAVLEGRYTQAMRLANIGRYCDYVKSDEAGGSVVALADGLPNNAAREFLLQQFPADTVVLVLVHTPRPLWEERLAKRRDNLVDIDIAGAEAYIRDNWEPVAPRLPHETIENGADSAAIDVRLRDLYRRYVSSPAAE
jgi:adenylate kinase family enzyme